MAYTYVHTHTYIYFTLFVGRSIIVNFLSVRLEINVIVLKRCFEKSEILSIFYVI